MSVGWMCVKMNEDIAEIIAAESLKRFGKYVWYSVILLLKFNHEKRTVAQSPLCRRRLVKEKK